MRALVELVLTGAGYTVLAAARPEDALAIAAREGDAIDALVTDIVMPGMSGLELAERLAPLRTLFISGYSAERRRAAAGSRPAARSWRSRSTTARCWPRSATCWTPRAHRVRAMIDESTDLGALVARHLREDRIVWLTTVTPAARRSRARCGSGGTARTPCTSSACRTRARTRNIEANPKVSLNFAGDGSGGDIVILSGIASLEPDGAGAHGSPDVRAEVPRGASSACGSRPSSSRSATRCRSGSA